MINENPIKILDTFLSRFKNLKQDNYKASIASFTDLLSFQEVIIVLEKLVKDGYVYKKQKPHIDFSQDMTEKIYTLTFEGLVFIGYEKSITFSESESQAKKMTDRLLILGTSLAGIGSISLVLWEIYKHFFLDVNC